MDQAHATLKKATELLPNESSGWENLARVEARQGRWAVAEGHFGKAISLQPKNPGVYRTRSACHREAKKWAEALADLDRALEREPASSPIWAADQVQRACLLFRLNRIAEALQATQESLRMKVDDAETGSGFPSDGSSAGK